MKHTGNVKFIEIGKAYCRSQKDCFKCPLLYKPCITLAGDLLNFDEALLEDVYDMLKVYTDWINDNDF